MSDDDRTIRFLGNNELKVLVTGDETGGAYCVLEMTIQPRGGATALHTDRWTEAFYVLEGKIDFTVERDGDLVTWTALPGESIVAPEGAKHRFAGGGDTPSRLLAMGPPEFERFFRALAAAWSGPYDRERTPGVVNPIFEAFGIRFCTP